MAEKFALFLVLDRNVEVEIPKPPNVTSNGFRRADRYMAEKIVLFLVLDRNVKVEIQKPPNVRRADIYGRKVRIVSIGTSKFLRRATSGGKKSVVIYRT